MQRLEVSCAVRPTYGSLGAKGLSLAKIYQWNLKFWRITAHLLWSHPRYDSLLWASHSQVLKTKHSLQCFASTNRLTPELNPSIQCCLARFSTGDFASWTVHFINICVKNHQMKQLFIQFINYVLQLLHVSALHYHFQGAFDRILWMGMLCLVTWWMAISDHHAPCH
jgi:hypothetical protein